MARKRMIDPSIWTSSSFIRLNYRQKLLFIGLISNADDYGKIGGDPTSLKVKIFAGKSVSDQVLKNDLKELESATSSETDCGMILQYRVNGKSFIWLPRWEAFQKMNFRAKTQLPNPSTEDLNGIDAVLTQSLLSP